MELILSLILLAFMVWVFVLLLSILIMGLGRWKGGKRQVEVRVDPKDKDRGFIAGGDRITHDKFANIFHEYPKGSFTVSADYRPKGNVNAKDYSRYHYDRKSHIMTKAERVFYKRLEGIFPDDCYIFPLVHLDDILQTTALDRNENWKEWAHVRLKSIDYLVCDEDFHIRLAIELDDWSHDFETRRHRDTEVERVFRDAKLPLLRCRNVNKISDTELKLRIIEEFRSRSQLPA